MLMLRQRKLNIPVTVTLLRSGLVNTSLQDQQLAKSLFQDPRPTLQSFAAGLVRECLSSDPPVASQNQLTYTIEVLGQLVQAGKANEEYVSVGLLLIRQPNAFQTVFNAYWTTCAVS